jgi:hypothetical protein
MMLDEETQDPIINDEVRKIYFGKGRRNAMM